MKIERYCGICACCFQPIKDGQEFKFNDDGRHFHKFCIQDNPDSYYVKLEEIKSRFKNANQKELLKLMSEIERSFKIPMMNDENFNQDN